MKPKTKTLYLQDRDETFHFNKLSFRPSIHPWAVQSKENDYRTHEEMTFAHYHSLIFISATRILHSCIECT